jgi:hypothetical protein
MPSSTDLDKLSVRDLSARLRDSMVPLSNTFSYFAVMPLNEEDVREYLEEPIAAIPPTIAAVLPRVFVGLVPYLERRNGKEKTGQSEEIVSFDKPAESRQVPLAYSEEQAEASLIFAIKDRQIAEYHHEFYQAIARLAVNRLSDDHRSQYNALLREELSGHVHGEVDQPSWYIKQALLRRQTNLRRETKLFREYAQQSLADTLALYLHGICCDIDVETGPRQLPSRYLRRRLELLEALYPPPEGYAVFPEELNK